MIKSDTKKIIFKTGNKLLSQKHKLPAGKDAVAPCELKTILDAELVLIPAGSCDPTAVTPNQIEQTDSDVLINCTNDLLWSVNSDFKLIAANKAFFKAVEDLVSIVLKPGDRLLIPALFSKTDIDYWEACYKKALSGQSFDKEFYTAAFNKRNESWTETSFNPIYKNGIIIGITCHSRNITEKKIIEEKIRQSEFRLAEVQEVARLGSWETDLKTLDVIWSAETYRIFEVDPNKFHASHPGFLEFVHPDDRKKLDEAFVNSLHVNSINSIEHRIITASGHIKFVEERWRIFHNNEGNPARAVGTCQDITIRKKTEARIKETEIRYHSLIEQATDAICIADASMKIVEINSRGYQMLGYTKAEFLLLTIADLFVPEDFKTTPLKIEELNSGNIISNERRLKRKDGTIVEVEINARLLEDKGFVIFARDITERKKGEKELQAVYHEKNIILESIDDGFFAIDKNSLVTYWNRKAEELLDEKREVVIGRNLHDMFTRPDSKVFYENYQKAIRENSTVHFEGFSHRTNKWFAVSAFASDNGLSVHFKDVTERKAFEEKIKESELNYRSLIEQAIDTICIIGSSFKFIDINPSGCNMFGYSKDEVLNLYINDVLFDEDLKSNPIKMEDLRAGKTISNERRIKRKDGTATEVELNGKMLADGRIIIFGRDISERKKAEAKLKESETKYRTLFEQNMAGVYQTTEKGVILNCNNAFAKMLKYDSADELLKINASELYFLPEERDDFTSKVKTQNKTNNYESVLKCKDGSALYFIENISVRRDDETGEALFDGIMIDITEKKQAELLLKESNERCNLISEATNDMVWDWDLATGKVFRNREGWRKIFRTGEDEIAKAITAAWGSRIHPDDRDRVKAINDGIHNSVNNFFEIECRVLRDDGTYAYINDRGNVIRDEKGKPIRVIGACQDITQRKMAELQVVKSELRFRSLVQNSSDIICIFNDRGYFLYSSPAIKKVLGFNPEETIEKNAFAFLHPDDVKPLKNYLSYPKPDMHHEMPLLRFKNTRGEWRWIESRVTNMCNNPEIAGYVFNCRDVTERKIAEAEIEKLSIIARETTNAVIITNTAGEIIWVNEGFTNITEYESDEVIGRKPGDILQGEETNLAVVRFMRNKIKKVEPFECDILNYSKTGRKYWLRIQCQPQFDETGKLKCYFAVETDITKEKEAEEILKASEERYRYLFNNNPASIIIWDVNTFKILEINNTAISNYGYSRLEFLEKNILELTLAEVHDDIKHFASIALMKGKVNSELTCKHINKSGDEMYMRISSHLIQFKERQVILALANNITDKIFLEKELENERLIKQQEITAAVISAQEQERQELGSELHDNINQILAGSRLYLGLAIKDLKINHPYLTETDTLINTAITEIRNLSHSLIHPSLHESELLGAINNIVEITQKTSGIKINLQACGFDESLICDKLKLSIYRIIQEQFNNILKHAGAEKIVVRLLQDKEKTLLSIQDDGAGFDSSKKAKGVGLINIKTRASLFNGEMIVISSPGNGCELRVLFN